MAKHSLRNFFRKLFIAFNVTIGICFILSCYATELNQGDYWFIGLFPLGGIYFLATLVVFIFLWFIVKPFHLSLISILSILICFKPMQHLIAFRINNPFELKKNYKDIRIMSWNVEHFEILQHDNHPELKTKMIELINEYQPDIACFQEMVSGDDKKKSINITTDFSKQLKMYQYYYSFDPKLDYDIYHHFGIVIFSKYPIIDTATIKSGPNDYNSIFQYIDIVANNDTFRVFNIHLQTLRFSNNDKRFIYDPLSSNDDDIKASKNILLKFKRSFIKRHHQVDRIASAIKQSPYPVILCGDFNDVPNSYAYNKIDKELHNSFVEMGSGIGNTFSGITSTLRIDNIFIDQKFQTTQFTRIKKRLSDHYPIISDIRLKK
jgi:endonuclease/exonuclease/phosphatase family metal-dependent hydrolase